MGGEVVKCFAHNSIYWIAVLFACASSLSSDGQRWITLTCSIATECGSPSGAKISLINLDGNPDHRHDTISPPSGIVRIDNVLHGFYDLYVAFDSFQVYQANSFSIHSDTTIHILLKESCPPPTGIHYNPNTCYTWWDPPIFCTNTIFSEGFESGSIPSGWTYEYMNDTVDWIVHSGSPSGFPNYSISGDFNTCITNGNATTILITPELDLSSSVQSELVFWHTQAGDSVQDQLNIYYKTANTAQWQLLVEYYAPQNNWIRHRIPLPSLSDSYSIGFAGNVHAGGLGICLDDIQILSADTNSGEAHRCFEGYDIYMDGLLMATISDPFLTLTDPLLGINWVGVSTHCSFTSSIIIELVFLYYPCEVFAQPVNLTLTVESMAALLHWDPPERKPEEKQHVENELHNRMRDTQGLKYDDFELAGYNIWRNGKIINAYVDTNTFYSDTVSPGGIYYYSVTAVYDFGQSCLIEPPLEAVMGAKLNTPQGLMAQVLDNQDVLITWNPPDPYTGEWIAWDDGEYFGRVGLNGATTWYNALMFAPADLISFDGRYLTKARFVPSDVENICDFTLKVWTGENAANEVVSQPVGALIQHTYNTVMLNNPIMIDASQKLYIGFEMVQAAAGYPAGRDEFTNNDGKGNLLSFDAIEWEALSVYGIGGDWNIQGWVALEVANYAPAAPLVKKVVQNSGDLAFETVKTDQIATAPAENRGLIGYNLWRNGTKFTYVSAPDTVCTDSNLYPEYYKYYVSAVYDEGESFPEGPAYVTIVGTGDLGGNVFDHETGIPLMDATVVVQGNLHGTTGFEGSYMIEDIPEGTYDVTCEAYGYLMNTISDVVIEYQETTVLNFKMEKDSLVNMPVYDSRGNEVRVYPNPLRNYLNIESEGNFREIYLVNCLGRVIMKEDITYRKQIQIKTSGLAEGVYFIKCYTIEGNMIVKKIVLLR